MSAPRFSPAPSAPEWLAPDARVAPIPRIVHPAPNAFVRVDWPATLFFHYRIDAALLRPHIPDDFHLEQYNGSAWITLVALTMRNFEPCVRSPLGGWLRAVREQRFLNVRTYVRCGGEPGAFFLWGWLSRPWHLPLPARPFGLTCAFAGIEYAHEGAELRGSVRAQGKHFAYRAVKDAASFRPAAAGSLEEFVLEHDTAFYQHRERAYVFRARHEPWRVTRVEPAIAADSLLSRFGFWQNHQPAAAHFAEALSGVELTFPRPLDLEPRPHHGASAFYTMP